MSKAIIYLLEASVLLAILYSLYFLLLRKETFFSLNRFFLLGILGVSLLYPLISFELSAPADIVLTRPVEELSEIRNSYYDALESWSNAGTSSASRLDTVSEREEINYSGMVLTVVVAIYGIGLVALVFRLIWTYSWIRRLKSANPIEIIDGVTVVKVPYQLAPFSFLNAVFVHKDLLDSEEFAQILAHEQTHIKQKHSLDLIFVQLLAAVLWFNPVVWMLIKSLKTTHEYIADKKMINQGYSLVEYQSLLLRQLISNNSYGLVHHFNLSFIKRRITMMKIKESGRVGKLKAAFVLSTAIVFSLLIVQCNSRIEDQIDTDLAAGDLVKEAGNLTDQLISYSLPVLPEMGFEYDIDPGNALEVVILGGEVRLNGQTTPLAELESAIQESGITNTGIVVIKVDKAEKMRLVTDVQWALRKTNRRKLLYIGRTAEGDQVEMAFLLPPTPDSKEGIQMPIVDDEYARAHNLDLLKIKLGDNARSANQTLVYEFVKGQIVKGKSNYVVSAKPEADDTFNDYLVNLTYIQQGFNQIYQERTQELFGKNFYDLDTKNPLEKEQYDKVRNGIPRAISVAEI